MPPPNVPPDPPAVWQHPGPPEGWRPMSGLAVTSFVLSLLFIVVAVFGVWISELIPLGLGILTLSTVKRGERRGRALAIWAVVIALGAGSCSYALHSTARDMMGQIAESVLSALASEDAEDSKKAMKDWIAAPVLEEHPDRVDEIIARFEQVKQQFGAYQGNVELRAPLLGSVVVFMAPEGLVEIGTKDAQPAFEAMQAMWAKARFSKGTVDVALIFRETAKEGDHALKDVKPGRAARVLSDVRFFHASGSGS